MDQSHLVTGCLAFFLGACATAAVSATASDAPANAATIVKLAEAPSGVAPPKTATIRHLARGNNAYVGHLTMQPGAKVPVHRDASEEFIYVLSGGGTITIDGASTEIGEGDTIYMPANAEVTFANGDAEMVGLQVFAGPESAKKYEAWK